ncbi:1-acyl-sn-glycerol-3-phosphate acyltransferase [uncultured Arcticibacterium sp.]|uniref:1-acyl-sn-glycerol-3-phosphate acyltransferase n=1 Tax=uncultured Arcticibacterium sp. TaxID=2173042 RepID=UPI0030F593FB
MIARFFFALFRWKLIGTIPIDLKKGVIAVCPHTSWLDFPVGLMARGAMRRKIGYLGKAELFNSPVGFLFKWLGGTPVIRNANMNMVESYAITIKGADDMLFALAPEGTRKNVAKLKTGFYYMAVGGEIPIIPVGFDFKRKEVIISEPFMPTGDFEKDMKKHFVPFFKTIHNVKKDWLTNYENGIFA